MSRPFYVPSGAVCDDELWQDDTGKAPRVHPNLAYNADSLGDFLQQLNARRLHPGMTVDILSQHNNAVIATGVVKEVIPHEMFAKDTGHMHDAVIAVRKADGRVQYFNPDRVIPSSTALMVDRPDELSHAPRRHHTKLREREVEIASHPRPCDD